MKSRAPRQATPPKPVTIDLGINQVARIQEIQRVRKLGSGEEAEKVRLGGIASGILVEAEYIEVGKIGEESRELKLGEYVRVKGVARWPGRKGARPVPEAGDHKAGLILALRLKVGQFAGDAALLVYLDLLDRAAPSGKERLVQGVTMATMWRELGMSRRRYRLALERLNLLELVISKDERHIPDGSGGYSSTAQQHRVPFPTTLRVDRARDLALKHPIKRAQIVAPDGPRKVKP